MKTRNTFFNAAVGMLCLFATQISAQSIISPSITDGDAGMGCTGGTISDWIENSIMNYGSGSMDNLLAIGWYARSGGGTCIGLTFSEDGGANWVPQSFNPLPTYNLNSYEFPNVLIGGPYGSGNEYIVAVVYKAFDINLNFSQVYLDLYTIADPGTSSTTGFVHSCTIRLSDPSVSFRGLGDVRADAITKDISGALQADNFVVAWQDYAVPTMGGGPGLSTFYGSLSSIAGNCSLIPGAFQRHSNSSLSSNLPVSSFDIAGYQGANSDTAIITYRIGANVSWGKWEVTTAALTGPLTTMHAGTPSSMPNKPRVDAMDPYTINSTYPTTFFSSTYGTESLVTSANDVNYYNIQAGDNIATATLNGLGYRAGFDPVIACGPNSPDQYSICYSSSPLLGGNLIGLLQPIDASTGTLYTADYYRMDQSSQNVAPLGMGSSNDWIMNSGSPVPNSNFITWMSLDTIKYKITSTATTPSFKPATVGSIAMAHKYSLNPSPAKDEINIKGLNASDDYTITDITGRVVKTGNVKESAPHIDISVLSSGMYILNIGKNEKIKFVKQ